MSGEAAQSLENCLQAATYDVFKRRLGLSGCALCPELSRDRHSIVVDRGNPQAKIVAIGEAPGAAEDRQGRSFVGRSGRLLDRWMESVGLDTNTDMLILNMVKCRPPGNRPPSPQERMNCRPFLDWQLASVKPKVAILLGTTATKPFFPEQKGAGLGPLVGKFFFHPAYPGMPFFPLFHPAYLLRRPGEEHRLKGPFKILRTFLENEALLPKKEVK
jgi:uracil-DNA glycosylase family 4